jgi:hypothetical protein
MEIRTALLDKILKHFYADLAKSINPLEKAENKAFFCEKLSELAIALYNDTLFDEEKFLLEWVYPKFKSNLSAFNKTNLLLYIKTDEHSQAQLFQNIGIKEPAPLSSDELQELFIQYLHALTTIPKFLYLKEKDGASHTESIVNEAVQQKLTKETREQLKSKMPNFNRARQTLTFYYLLKGNKVQKDTHSVAAMARFIHNTLGIPYNDIDNSEFYDKLKAAPRFKKEPLLLKDLEYVKEQFQSIEAPDLARMVEDDIAAVRKAMKWK